MTMKPSMMDRAIARLSPGWALQRMVARARINALLAYEAADSNRLRKRARDAGSGNTAIAASAKPLRDYARHLERNHDLFRNAIRIILRNVVGPHGITAESQPRTSDGTVDQEFARQVDMLWRNWCKKPEVSWQHDWGSMCRLLVRRWVVDGEVLAQLVVGTGGGLNHGTLVPFSLEMLEADMLPLDFNDRARGITAGVERNAWSRPIAYHLYKRHPGEADTFQMVADTKRVLAERIRHVALRDRINQVRGVSEAASVMTRLDDLKDYEESERIAAKIAASFAAFIKKGGGEQYGQSVGVNGEALKQRELRLSPGMIFDDLQPGEEIGMIDTNRPNPNLQAFRDSQLRAVAGGIGVGFSSLSKHYAGNYSAQRQELIEQAGDYAVMAYEFICQFVQPVWQTFITTAVQSGQLRLPAGMDLEGAADAMFVIPQMPWVDPTKEATAWGALVGLGVASPQEVIRFRGRNPRDILDQRQQWQDELRRRDLPMPPPSNSQPPPVPDDPDDPATPGGEPAT